MEDVFDLIGELGFPIAGAMVMGYFIFIVIKQILEGVVDDIKTLTMFCKSLENRARTMTNEIVKIDMLVSSALRTKTRYREGSQTENFIEDEKVRCEGLTMEELDLIIAEQYGFPIVMMVGLGISFIIFGGSSVRHIEPEIEKHIALIRVIDQTNVRPRPYQITTKGRCRSRI